MIRRVLLLLVLLSLLGVLAPGLAAAQDDVSEENATTEESWDSSVIFEVGTVSVIEEDWGEEYIVVEANRAQDISLATKSSVTSTGGDADSYSLDEGETLRINLDGASWYSITSSEEFKERTSSTTLSLFQATATWSFVLRGFVTTFIFFPGVVYYVHWKVTRKRKKGARSQFSGEYIEDIPAHTSDDEDADNGGDSE